MSEVTGRTHFKREEVCQMVGIRPYVLRFWEAEFNQINPIFNSQGTKLYSAEDMEILKKIKSLLVEEKMTIERAKMCLQNVLDEECELPEELEDELKAYREEGSEKISFVDNTKKPETAISSQFNEKELKRKLEELVAFTKNIKDARMWS